MSNKTYSFEILVDVKTHGAWQDGHWVPAWGTYGSRAERNRVMTTFPKYFAQMTSCRVRTRPVEITEESRSTP